MAGRYDDFEQDFQLEEEDAPQLHADESEQAEAEQDAHTAALARAEQLAEAYARVDAAREEADTLIGARAAAGENVEVEEARLAGLDEAGPPFRCSHVDRFFCGIMGPLSKRQGNVAEIPPGRERDAKSQRWQGAAA